MTTPTIFNSFWIDLFRQRIALESDEVRVMLTTGYAPNKDVHARRSDVAAFEVSGAGYTSGGEIATVGVTESGDLVDATLAGVTWPTATLSATGAVYYKARGGDAADDELILALAFDAPISSTDDAWSLTASILRLNNA